MLFQPDTENLKKRWNLFLRNYSIPILTALIINLSLFGILPGLIRSVPDRPSLDDMLQPIDFIRIKRPDTDLKKKKPEKPPEPETKRPPEKTTAVIKPITKKIKLPFELNTKLPAGPQTLGLPPLDMLALNAPDLRNAFGVDEIDGPLTAIANIPPVYPMRASRMGIEGSVTIRFLVNESGLVDNIEIINAEPPGMFEKSVYNCASKWRFKPGTIEGIPVNTWAEKTIHFELGE